MEWLRAHKPVIENRTNSKFDSNWESGDPTPSGSENAPSLPDRDKTHHVFEPALTKQEELDGVGKVSEGGEESDNLEGRFTNVSKKQDHKSQDSKIKSLEKGESEVGKRVCEFDFLSEDSDSVEGDDRIAHRRKQERIGPQIENACHDPFFDSSPDIRSSPTTSVLVTIEEDELSDDNQKSDKSYFSEIIDTARKMSSSNITLAEAEKYDDDVEYIDAEDLSEIVVPEAGSRDENLEIVYFLTSYKPQDIATTESQPEPQTSANVNDDKPHSEEVSIKIQTPADNISKVVDDSANLAVPGPVKSLNDEKSGQESIKPTAKVLSPPEKHLLSSKSVTSSQKIVEKQTKSDDRCKLEPKSPKLSIEPSNVTNSKPEIETDSKKKQRSKSYSSASKKGSTSSEEKFPSEKRDASKNRDHKRRSSGEKRPKPRKLCVSTEISSRDKIQNLISDKKSMRSHPGKPSPCKSNSKFCVIAKLHALFCEKHKTLRMPIDESESDRSCRSGNTDSTTLPELDRISERLLPIRGTLTLIKGKSDRSPTSSWGSASSLLEDLTWKKRDENDPSNSLMSSFSTLFIQTQIQVDIHREMSSKSTIYDETKPPKGIYSESDTSSEYSQCKDMRITCEKVIKGTLSNNTDIHTKVQYCINSITFGLRRSLSDETLCPIEVYTPEEPKVRAPPGNLFNPNNCDACIFLLLLETLIVREKNIHLSNRKTDACLVHNVYLDYENSHIHHHLLKKMPLCDHCDFPSVEKTILQLVRFRHGVLIHKDDSLAPIYAMIPSYSDENETIGRIVHLTKKNVMDFGHKSVDFCPISVKIADRYILFPKLIDTSVWARFRLKRRDSPYKKSMSKIKGKNVQPMEDIPELNENISEDSRVKVKPERQTLKVTPKKNRSSIRKAKKCVAKKRSVQTTSAAQPSRKNGSTSDPVTSKNTVMSPSASISTAGSSNTTSANGKRKRCVLKKWSVKLSPKSKKKIINKNEEQVVTKHVSQSKGADKLPKPKPKRRATHKSRAKKKGDKKPLDQIDGIVLVRKRRPWWKCPKKEDEQAKKKCIEAATKKNLEYYKKFIHPTYQQPFYSYIFKSPKGRYWETKVVTRQDVLAQRLAYHYIRRLTLHRSSHQKHLEKSKPSLTDFQSFKYEERRAFIRNSRHSESITSDELDLNESKEKEHDVEYYSVEELTTSEKEPESPLNLAEYDLSKIEYHFEDCHIIQAGATPYKHFLKLLEVHKTNSEESWIEYHVENCSYYIIDGNTVAGFKVVDLVLVEKKNDTICDCAEKLIKGANTYQQDRSSQMFHHDLCLLFPHQMEIGDIDLQSLFHPNIPSRQFHRRDFLRFYFISKSQDDTEEAPVISYRDVPISKFEQVQKNIKITLSQLDRGQAGTSVDSLPYTSPVASTSTQTTFKTYQLGDGEDIESILHHHDEELSEDQFILSPPRADSDSEDSESVYSLEECLLFANEHLTDDSMSTPTPDLTEGIEYQNLSKHSEEYSPSGSAYSISQFAISPRASVQPQDFKSIYSGKTNILPRLKPQEGEIAGKYIKSVEPQPSTSKDNSTSVEQIEHIPMPELYMSILKRRFKSHEDLSTFDELIEDDTRALSALPPIMMGSPRQDDQQRSQEEQVCQDCECKKFRNLREQFGASEASYKICGVLGHSFCYEYPLEELLQRESFSAPCPGTYHEITSQSEGYRRPSSLSEEPTQITQTSQSDPSHSDMQYQQQDASDDDSLPWHSTNG